MCLFSYKDERETGNDVYTVVIFFSVERKEVPHTYSPSCLSTFFSPGLYKNRVVIDITITLLLRRQYTHVVFFFDPRHTTDLPSPKP